MSRKTRTVIVPGHVVDSDEKEVYLDATYDYEPVTQFHPMEEPEGGVYLEGLYWDRPDGLRIAIGWSDESWVDQIIDQLYNAEAH